MNTIDYCVWLKDYNGDYITSCDNTTISKDNYIKKYCTCCGRKIVMPVLIKTYKDNPKTEVHYAN